MHLYTCYVLTYVNMGILGINLLLMYVCMYVCAY